MHIVIFGLTISSSWGNGHATLWRALVRAMLARGHTVTFYERDVPYYSSERDLHELPPGASLRLYDSLEDIEPQAARDLDRAQLAICTSYCPDGPEACRLLLESKATLKAFYDLDTPVTLDRLSSGADVDYLPPGGLGGFDFVLSYTGGRALEELVSKLGAHRVFPLYGFVDPEAHFPTRPVRDFQSMLSFLGTYADDRSAALKRLLLTPARELPQEKFIIGGAGYPADFPASDNCIVCGHLAPALHSAFFSSSHATLNITRKAMARYGFCPSGRLFEAAACAVPILSDWWEGLETFFRAGEEILIVNTTEDVLECLALSDIELRRMAEAARARTLAEHTARSRIAELEAVWQQVAALQLPMAKVS